MVYSIVAKSGERPRWHQLEHAIKRNFGGLVEGEPVEIFKRHYRGPDVSLPYVVVHRDGFKETFARHYVIRFPRLSRLPSR